MNSQTVKKIRHTYLLEEGKWNVSGTYYDSCNNEMELKGEQRISHHEDQWLLDSRMELQDMSKTIIQSTYKIEPATGEGEFTFWESDDPDLGQLLGRFMIVGNTIMSMYQSESRLYAGTETLEKVDENKYQVKGFSFNGDEKLASWKLTLERSR